MLDMIFAMLAAGLNGSAAEAPEGTAPATAPVASIAQPSTPAAPSQTVQIAPEGVVIGQGVLIEGATAFNMDAVPPGLTADPQVPTGLFTTATEIKPILNATKSNWVAVREYDGQDLLYITHLWSWRCGLNAIAISINGETMQNWPMPACHAQTATPNAILPGDGQPYLTLRLGAVEQISIQIVYDDMSMDTAEFSRNAVLIP